MKQESKKKLVTNVTRKALDIKFSGRSSDYITPSFGYGCLYNCTYCYCKRNVTSGLTIAKNVDEILTAINSHAYFIAPNDEVVNKPNQTHDKFYTYDISCNEDFALHRKHHDWKRIFDFFKDHELAMATFATKNVPTEFLNYFPDRKVRIRFSLMPQRISTLLEPGTATIVERLAAINTFIEAGYDVHVNFSPVVVYKKWLEDYKVLFTQLDNSVKCQYKTEVKAEVIFLTHSEKKHQYNVQSSLTGEHLLWAPQIQEGKISTYGQAAIRYDRNLKQFYINQFKELHNSIIPWNTIRYIF